jgi:hypothetical protein
MEEALLGELEEMYRAGGRIGSKLGKECVKW